VPDRATRILFVTAEAAPLVKVGGLADVAAALPKALVALGLDVRVLLPAYGVLDREAWNMRPYGRPFPVSLGGEPQVGRLWRTELDGVPFLLADHEPTFGGQRRIYSDDPATDAARFTVFCALALGALTQLEADWRPDLVHLNDWHTGPLGRWLRGLAGDGVDYPTLLTIHNLQYQGLVLRASTGWSGNLLPATRDGLVNFLAEGLLAADAINTVSPTYAREILTPELGAGLWPLLRSRAGDVHGIVNGIDTTTFDPATDPAIPARYDVTDLAGKARCKEALQREVGLPARPDVPLLGMVGRLAEQKGLDILYAALPDVLGRLDLQLVLLGTGDPAIEAGLAGLALRYPESVRLLRRFDAALAQRIYAGADIFLMPSRFEPCGLGQQIAMRYGTVPLVRSTGGLVDTVRDLSEPDGTGVRFDDYTPGALAAAVDRTLVAYRQPETWRAAQRRGMEQDLSWAPSARRYAELYDTTAERHRLARTGG
jgi:starch synthase